MISSSCMVVNNSKLQTPRLRLGIPVQWECQLKLKSLFSISLSFNQLANKICYLNIACSKYCSMDILILIISVLHILYTYRQPRTTRNMRFFHIKPFLCFELSHTMRRKSNRITQHATNNQEASIHFITKHFHSQRKSFLSAVCSSHWNLWNDVLSESLSGYKPRAYVP